MSLVELRGLSKHFPAKVAWPRDARVSWPRRALTRMPATVRAVDAVDLAIVQHRCTAEVGAWCRMYKDRTCKRERTPEEIARRAGLDLSPEQAARRVDGLREKILDGLGRAFPDYNSCLNERKPDRG